MKNLKLTFLVSLFVIGCAKGQVDTTDWFPMQTGNYWEYMAWDSPPKYFSIKVLSDTLMPNGKIYKPYFYKYFGISLEDTRYFRKDSIKVYEYFGFPIYCPESEYLYLDFSVPDSTIWEICRPIDDNARGVALTFYDYTYYSFFQKPNEAKQFEHVYVDSVDTIWTPTEGSVPIGLNRGLGIVWHFMFNDGSYEIQGTIINGVRMGIITAIQNEIENITNFFTLSQNYPNPFNPSTSIQYAISNRQFVSLKVFDVLGKEVATLVNEEKSAGSYEVEFKSSVGSLQLASGIYYYQLRAGAYIETKKMVLMR